MHQADPADHINGAGILDESVEEWKRQFADWEASLENSIEEEEEDAKGKGDDRRETRDDGNHRRK
ncbi:MAG: hypothetical protein B1H02_07710 [Candidatus Latescibacteria bacterium 4484_107]|nr:MAG: hypothetical protein B1H02_07710 [Candidatus Latescibacteria bacterium 4484_107]